MNISHRYIRRSSAFFLALTMLVMLSVLGSCAQSASAAVIIRAHDGDTFHVHDGGSEYKVRLWAVDAPERGQPGCGAALMAMTDMAVGESLKITARGKSYDRTVAQVQTKRGDLAEMLLREGLVLLDERYSKKLEYRNAQSEAQANRRGLWGTKFTQPWVWRKQHTSRGKACE